MKTVLVFISIVSILFAEDISLEKISVEDTILNDAPYIASEEKSLETRSILLQDKLQRDVSILSVPDAKGEVAISFRGLDFKNTNYIEDGIPLYRSVNGFVDARFNMSQSEVVLNDGSGTSSLGVSSAGGEVEIKSTIPTKELETKLESSISNNDEFYHAYLGSSQDNVYVQADMSYYHRSDYQLSDDYKPTSLQQKGKRVNSDKEQQNFSLKSGVFVNDNLHLAAKLSLTRSEYGMPVNVYPSIPTVWNAYTRINRKDLNTLNLYADYDVNDIELSFRAYYDKYSDIYAIYNQPTYQTHDPIATYDDNRLGTIIKGSLTYNNTLNTLIYQAEINEHERSGGNDTSGNKLDNAQNQINTHKLSYLNEWELNQLWTIESGLSFTIAQQVEASDESASKPAEDKKTYDAQIKAIYTNKENSIYAGIAKKSRMPSMFEMVTMFPNTMQRANPNLKPERSMQYTTGYQHNFNTQSSLGLALYYYDISDLIITRNNTYINRDKAKHYGTEVRFNTKEVNKHTLGVSYAYAHARDSAGESLELIPKHQLKIEDSIRISQKLKAYFAYQFMSSRHSSNSATYTDEQMQMSEYHLLEAQVSYKLSPSINSRLGIKNLLDESYEFRYGYPSQGRSYYVSLEWKL
ncbi:TonB-dependent receptor [Sulfurimonas sp.]|nr:TonB-dependent receptor [Sulfurimonas sp.]